MDGPISDLPASVFFDVLLSTIVFSIAMSTTTEEIETQLNFVLTTDTLSNFIFSTYRTTVEYVQHVISIALLMMSSFDEAEKDFSLYSAITEAMPPDLYDYFDPYQTDLGDSFAWDLEREFNSQTYPSWLAQLPEEVQTYFITRWMGAVLDSTDLLGSSLTFATALGLTKGAGGMTTTAAGSVTFAYLYKTHDYF
jgi:hypothetical protein